MSRHGMVAVLAAMLAPVLPLARANAFQSAPGSVAHESRLPLAKGSLYLREIGRGRSIIVLHGGPDFDIGYLLPELDQWADGYRLIYYDQRGRGKSARQVDAQDVTLASDVADVDRVRQHFQLPTTVVLGHSWGAILAAEYALRHPGRVSQLILMNPAPFSTADHTLLRNAYLAQLGADMDRQREMLNSAAYKEGDPEAVAARYRIHFEHALARPADYETLMARMKAGFIIQRREGIIKARAVEDRLLVDTWDKSDYDLMPKLRNLKIPTLVITGDRDFIPVEVSQHIVAAIPNGRLVTLEGCGHFTYLECAGDVRKAVDEFLQR